MNKQNYILGLTFVFVGFLFSACENKTTGSSVNTATPTKTVANSSNQNQNETGSKDNSSSVVSNKNNLNVSVDFWKQQMEKAMAARDKPVGERPEGLNVPTELNADGIIKQKTKLAEIVANGYNQPLDFADLAEKRMKNEMVELPMATETYVLDVGGNANENEFSSYSFEDGSVVLKPDSPKFMTLKKLADDFDGTKYDLSNPTDRKQVKIRLLRMINPQARTILEEIAVSYQKQFNRPLKIVSMIRSMDYQIELNKVDSSTYKVNNKNALPPHLSGCAFDIARKHLTAEEQNFIMQKLGEIEKNGKVDALIEFGPTPVFHVFVYQDGKPPQI